VIRRALEILRPPSPNTMRQKLIDDAMRDEIESRKAIEDLRVSMQYHQSNADMLAQRVARLREEMKP
jgi:hypothetical protein